jgi:hypothetical protein
MAAVPSADEVRSLLDYDPETGIFRWEKAQSNRVKVGQRTGCLCHYGYQIIGINGRVYRAARLAWLIMTGEWPSVYIDHVNGDRADDRWVNLREATPSDNMCNRKRQSHNTSGHVGVSFEKQRGLWRARITKNGRTLDLGFFPTSEAAAGARRAELDRVHGAFARLN